MSGSRLRTEHDAVLYYLTRLQQGSGGSGGLGPTGPTGPAGSTGSAGANGAVISVANGAALTAISTAALVQGALALVRSRQTLWAYQPGDGSAADGWHIAAAGGGNWVYVAPADAATLAQQANWYIDPQNSTGLASDDNTGATALLPLLHKAEVSRRWGQLPSIAVQVTINYLSADTAATDPWAFPAIFTGNASGIRHTAPLPASSFTGTLLAVTAKNTAAGGNALQSTFTTVTGAIAANMLLVNTTRANSRAFVQRNISGGNWQITQPRTPYAGTGLATGAEVNTWANGDSIVGYTLPAISIADASSVFASIGSAFTNLVTLWQIAPTSFGIADQDQMILGGTYTQIQECVLNCGLSVYKLYQLNVINSVINSVVISGGSGNELLMYSGAFQASGLGGATPFYFFDQDCILRPTNVHNNLASSFLGNTAASNLCIDTTVNISGFTTSQDTGLATLYGGGTLNVLQGTLMYSLAATGKINITLNLNGVATGYSNATAGGVTTVHGGIALTPGNLDAAAGAAGFGGYAFGGGAVITAAGVPP
jgi:hypothetical protein